MNSVPCNTSDDPCISAYGYDACCMAATAVTVPTDDVSSSWENAAKAMVKFGLPIS